MAGKKNNMADKAYELLCDKIMRFELVPGLVVSDHSLSQTLGMSRTPIREALVRLQRDGLVEVASNNKMVITQATVKDAEEIAQARMAIECKAIDLIYARGGLTDEERTELRRLHDELMRQIGLEDLRGSYAADDTFHMATVRFSGNSRLVNFFSLLHKQMLRARYITTILNQDWFDITATEHKKLLRLWMEESDREVVKEAIAVHLCSTDGYTRVLFRDNPDDDLISKITMFFKT